MLLGSNYVSGKISKIKNVTKQISKNGEGQLHPNLLLLKYFGSLGRARIMVGFTCVFEFF
jgi:hypothetical protein